MQIDTNKLEKEIKSQREILKYNFLIRINTILETGTMQDIIDIVASYRRYVNALTDEIMMKGDIEKYD